MRLLLFMVGILGCSTSDFVAGHEERIDWPSPAASQAAGVPLPTGASWWICAYKFIPRDPTVPPKDGIHTLKPVTEANLVCGGFKTPAYNEGDAEWRFNLEWPKWAGDPSRPEYRGMLAFGPRCRPVLDVN